MTSFAPVSYRRTTFDEPTYPADPSWRQDYYPQGMMLTHTWPQTSNQQMSGMQHLDVKLFPDEEQQYADLSYSQHDTWSDLETAGTPSTHSQPNESPNSCFNPLPTPSIHLQIPDRPQHMMGHIPSPQSSYASSVSPTPSPMPMPVYERPATAKPASPNDRNRKAKTSSRTGVPGEMILSNDDNDTEYMPNNSSDARRTRKRARIPHTAVERRYRENLNAHLDKLRQAVPTLASPSSREAAVSANMPPESVKPSKCEILNGAIEHIGNLGRENIILRNEVSALRAKIGDYDAAWYRAGLR